LDAFSPIVYFGQLLLLVRGWECSRNSFPVCRTLLIPRVGIKNLCAINSKKSRIIYKYFQLSKTYGDITSLVSSKKRISSLVSRTKTSRTKTLVSRTKTVLKRFSPSNYLCAVSAARFFCSGVGHICHDL
jgi:hypothetical protein